MTVTYSTIDNEVLSLGQSPPQISTAFRLQSGYPLYGAWAPRYTYSDANRDGVIVPAEVLPVEGSEFLGSSTPTRELGIAPYIEVGRFIKVAALIDHRGGFRTHNVTGRLRCLAVCAALYAPDASPAQQARAVSPSVALGGWIEDATFARLRELSLSWRLPARWSTIVGARSTSLTLAGRNLATWTRYTGIDPEVTLNGQSRISQEEFMTLAVPRTLSLRLDTGW